MSKKSAIGRFFNSIFLIHTLADTDIKVDDVCVVKENRGKAIKVIHIHTHTVPTNLC